MYDAIRHISDAAFLHKAILPTVKGVNMCIQTDGSHFEHLLNWTVQSFFQEKTNKQRISKSKYIFKYLDLHNH